MNAEKILQPTDEKKIFLAFPTSLSETTKRYMGAKRLMDIIFSVIGLVIAAPLMLLFAILIVMETPGLPFYKQKRVGKDGVCFYLLKLRSMSIDAEKGGAVWATINDPRVTKVGSFIRKTRIDELPQLLMVLKGDMSLIGPRPERPEFTDKFNSEIDGFTKRLMVKPGLTGLAQVNGGYNITPQEKLVFDITYIKHLSFFLELKIVAKTFKVLFTGEGAR